MYFRFNSLVFFVLVSITTRIKGEITSNKFLTNESFSNELTRVAPKYIPLRLESVPIRETEIQENEDQIVENVTVLSKFETGADEEVNKNVARENVASFTDCLRKLSLSCLKKKLLLVLDQIGKSERLPIFGDVLVLMRVNRTVVPMDLPPMYFNNDTEHHSVVSRDLQEGDTGAQEQQLTFTNVFDEILDEHILRLRLPWFLTASARSAEVASDLGSEVDFGVPVEYEEGRGKKKKKKKKLGGLMMKKMMMKMMKAMKMMMMGKMIISPFIALIAKVIAIKAKILGLVSIIMSLPSLIGLLRKFMMGGGGGGGGGGKGGGMGGGGLFSMFGGGGKGGGMGGGGGGGLFGGGKGGGGMMGWPMKGVMMMSGGPYPASGQSGWSSGPMGDSGWSGGAGCGGGCGGGGGGGGGGGLTPPSSSYGLPMSGGCGGGGCSPPSSGYGAPFSGGSSSSSSSGGSGSYKAPSGGCSNCGGGGGGVVSDNFAAPIGNNGGIGSGYGAPWARMFRARDGEARGVQDGGDGMTAGDWDRIMGKVYPVKTSNLTEVAGVTASSS